MEFGWVGGAAYSTRDLVRGTGGFPSFQYFCIRGSSGWASVMVRYLKPDNNSREG